MHHGRDDARARLPGQLADEYPCLRAADAVQRATAIEVNGRWIKSGLSGIVLVSADDEQNKAARAEGMRVEDPCLHP
jgi:hypothetical protein